MKTNLQFTALCALAASMTAFGQGFDSGSDGSLGALEVVDADVTVNLPDDGELHYTTVTVGSGRTLRFNRNAMNTPVFLLATGDIQINGTLDVTGADSPSGTPTGGSGGPGGFDGGKPGFGSGVPPGDGYGPGGGIGGAASSTADGAGGGGYGAPGSGGQSTLHGGTYGSPLLIPLIGGSGGGGTAGQPGRGGGGGGGAVLLASNTRITVNGIVRSRGGGWSGSAFHAGSGGAIRLVAPVVNGGGTLDVTGGGAGGGAGRIRVDTVDRRDLRFTFSPNTQTTLGANMFIAPTPMPRLDLIQVADLDIALGSGPVTYQLPFGSDPNVTVTVRAQDFGSVVPIEVVLTPDSGPRSVVAAEIDNTTVNPATVDVPITVPVNTVVTVHVWKP
ncbi:MAG TPA: hypothetical protein VMS21_15870 [Methylomirabilota bacterium]|nr:hypothetical protein [Methylomirabilota bacterium]